MPMKNNYFKTFSLLVATTVAISGCKSTDWTKVKYEVTPNPLEVSGDSVAVAVKVNIPPKVFISKTSVTVVPSIKWKGGEKALKPITFQGEKVKGGTGVVVNTEKGGTFPYSDKVAYQPEMKNSELAGTASVQVGSKKKDVVVPAMAPGVITTAFMVVSDEKPMMSKGDLSKVPAMAHETDIHFAINQSKVRTSERETASVKGMGSFLRRSHKEGKKENAAASKAGKAQAAADKKSMEEANTKIDSMKMNYFVKNVEIVSSASIDGKQDFNAKLAQDRGISSEKFVSEEMVKSNVPGSQAEGFFKKSFVAEDWDGFKALVEKSAIADKDKVLSVVSSTSDLDQRETQLRAMKKTWKELVSKVLPKTRKAVVKVMAQKKAKSVEEINKIYAATPDSLSQEEILFAADNTSDMAAKAAIYANVSKMFPNDWRGFNNAGGVNLMQNKLEEAQAQFEKANTLSPNNPVVLNNMGVIAMKKGDRKTAEANFTAAMSGGMEPKYNMGNLYVKQGKYTDAVASYGDAKSFNVALAALLSGNNDAVPTKLEGTADNESAMGYYLKAIAGARKGDAAVAVGNLKNAIAKDATLKDKAKEDLEFTKVKTNDAFKALLQ
jgi:tetratricopeptide (TPR) repeat protein